VGKPLDTVSTSIHHIPPRKEAAMSMATAARALTIRRRPGWVTFAAVVTFMSAASYGLIALIEFSNSRWFVTTHPGTYGLLNSHFFWWGIIDTALCVLAVVAGLSIFRGGVTGMMLGFSGAIFSAVRWMFFIPSDPWLAVTIVVLDILVVYGMSTSGDYFIQGDFG
jgi:hypothetical protein